MELKTKKKNQRAENSLKRSKTQKSFSARKLQIQKQQIKKQTHAITDFGNISSQNIPNELMVKYLTNFDRRLVVMINFN